MNDFVLAWYNCYPEHPIIFSARLTIVTSIVRAQDNKLVALTEDSETVVSVSKLGDRAVQDTEDDGTVERADDEFSKFSE
jgi:hypothetical protein